MTMLPKTTLRDNRTLVLMLEIKLRRPRAPMEQSLLLVENGAPNPKHRPLKAPLVEDSVEELSLLAVRDGMALLAEEVGRLERMPPGDSEKAMTRLAGI